MQHVNDGVQRALANASEEYNSVRINWSAVRAYNKVLTHNAYASVHSIAQRFALTAQELEDMLAAAECVYMQYWVDAQE